MEFLTQQNIVRVPVDQVETLILTIKTILSQTQSFGTNFPLFFGQTQCSSGLNSNRQTAFMTSANVPVVGLETSYSDQISFEMVNEHQSLRSRNTHSPSRPQCIPLYRCQSFRLGSSSGTDVYPFMVAGRKTNPSSISTC